MAGNAPLEEFLTCSICLDTYKDPHMLSCMHTFCEWCIKHLEKGLRVRCPECRTYTEKDDIKQDFKTQSLLDIVFKGASTHDKKHPLLITECDLCHRSKTCISSRCCQCKQYMCQDCERIHNAVITNTGHTLLHMNDGKSLEEAVTEDVKQTLDLLTVDLNEMQQEGTKHDMAVIRIEKSQARQLDQVKRFCEQLVKQIHVVNMNILTSLKDEKEVIQKCCDDLGSKIQTLSELQIKDDPDVLCGVLESIKSIKADSKAIQQKVKLTSQDASLVTSPVILQNSYCQENGIGLNYILLPNPKSSVQHTDLSVLSQLSEGIYTEMNQETLGHYPQRLRLINNQLWCAGGPDNKVYIYNKDCRLLGHIKNKLLLCPRAVAKSHTGAIIVACEESGLIQFNSSGSLPIRIAVGNFIDIRAHRNRLFALECSKGQVVVFEHRISGRWSKVDTLKLHYQDVDSWDTLGVNEQGVYVCSVKNHCLYLYDTCGELQSEAGAKGDSKPGKLQRPFICDVDSAGNALVADWENNRLQMYHRTGHWTVMKDIRGPMALPVDAVVDSQLQFIWLVQSYCTSNCLIKFHKICNVSNKFSSRLKSN